MELIMAILVSLGFITKKSESYNLNKIKTTETYQKVYNKAREDLNVNPQAWADILNIK